MRFTNHKRRRAPAIIIVSLIDVLIVVLIFLVVSTTAKKVEPSLKLALPESKTAKPGATADAKPFLILVATNFPFFYLENKPVTFDRLNTELLAAAKRNPKVSVVIKADKKSPFGEIIRVIDAARAANVGSVSAITEKAPGP